MKIFKKYKIFFCLIILFAIYRSCFSEVEVILGKDKILVSNFQRGVILNPDFEENKSLNTNPIKSSNVENTIKKFENKNNIEEKKTKRIKHENLFKEHFKRPEVASALETLNYKNNLRVEIGKDRLRYYEDMFVKIFEEEGVPSDLIAMGFVESTYSPSAYSEAGASGIWQFIPSTGKVFGLVSEEDFSDPVKSTKAAAKYLKRLNKRFGNWLLSVAAYNAGETRVQQAINQANGSNDFWEISQYLPKETRYYVPNVLAATTILN